MIDVPDLSLREKYLIDRRAGSAAKVLKSLPFRPDDPTSAAEMEYSIESYIALRRYYPTFHHIDP